MSDDLLHRAVITGVIAGALTIDVTRVDVEIRYRADDVLMLVQINQGQPTPAEAARIKVALAACIGLEWEAL